MFVGYRFGKHIFSIFGGGGSLSYIVAGSPVRSENLRGVFVSFFGVENMI